MFGAIIGAVVGGAAGAAIWAAVGYYTGYEIGWVAWGVGVLAGLGAAVGSNLLGSGPDTGTGILAAVVALVAVLCGKLAVVEMHYLNDADLTLASEFTDEVLMSYVADQVAEQWEDDGIDIDWPELPEDQWFRWRQEDYPADLWATAVQWWDETPADHQAKVRQGYRREHEQNLDQFDAFYAEIQNEGMFSGFDFIWMILAVASAFGIGRGGADE